MKTPTWAVVIGIILMLFGGCGMFKHGQSIVMPDIMDMQQRMMESAMKDIEINEESYDYSYEEEDARNWVEDTTSKEEMSGSDEVQVSPPPTTKRTKIRTKEMTKAMKEMFALSDFNRKWMIRFGYIGIIVCAIYLMSGAFLINRKFFGIKFVFGALTLSIVFSLVQMIVISSDTGSGFIGKMSSYGNIFGLVLDLILLIVFASINKSDYLTTNQAPPPAKEDWENF